MLPLIGDAPTIGNFTHRAGYLGAGSDLLPPPGYNATTLHDALSLCTSLPKCKGITFAGSEVEPSGIIPKVYLKGSAAFTLASGWHTWQLDFTPPPPTLTNPCLNASLPFKAQKWCDASASIDERVADMLSRMSLEEKFGQLGTDAPPVPSLGLPYYQWWSESTHGVASGSHGARAPTTNFAFPITTGMAFNRSLWFATGAAIGREARALMNAGQAYSTFWAPVINLARDPRWGRNIETPGEDPYLTGRYAVSFVKGMQEAAEDPYHIQASACCKHYVANSMDSSKVDGVSHYRAEFDATVPMQDLVDSYMPPFQTCVEEGRVSGLMCSYNAVNGVPTCASDWLLSTVARGEWAFDGYVTSDCDADADVFNPHHFTSTKEEAVAAVLHAGTDVDCGSFVPDNVASAVTKGQVSEADLDARLYNLFKVRMRLGHFDPPGPLQRISPSVVCAAETQALAADGTAQSATLLKNEGSALPLARGATVAVLGPMANLSRTVAGYYGPSAVCGGNLWTLTDAVAKYASLSSAASEADAVIVALGTDLGWAMEGHDADPVNGITIPASQLAIVQQATAAAKRPVVVVTLTATPLDISPLLADPKVGAILHLGMPSVAVLGAGEVLFGRPPAGRTVQTIYPQQYATQVSIFDMLMRPGPSAFPAPGCSAPAPQCPNGTNPGRTYRFYNGDAVVPFGFGLSYTTFRYAHAAPPASRVDLSPLRALLGASPRTTFLARSADGPAATFAVNVTNQGAVDADDVILGFITPPGAGKGGVPRKQLFGFERAHVPAGATVTVYLYPALGDFAQVDGSGVRRAHAGDYLVTFGLRESLELGMGYLEHTLEAV